MPTPAGKIQRSATGKINRNASGKIFLGTGIDTCCCAGLTYRVRKCCGNAYVNYEITPPTVPFYFKHNVGAGLECLYVTGASTPVTPGTYTVIPLTGLATYPTCTDCVDGVGCNACAISPNPNCCRDSCGSTISSPTSFTVTFSGISVVAGCMNKGFLGCDWVSSPASLSASVAAWSGGSFTVPYESNCLWRLNTTGPDVTLYDAANCTGNVVATLNKIQVIVTKFTSPFFWIVEIIHEFAGDALVFYVDAQSTPNTALFACCVARTFSNRADLATGAPSPCDPALGGLTIGGGGTVTVTPC